MSETIRINAEKLRRELQQAPVVTKRNHFWEPWEDEIVKEFYGKRDPELIAKKLNRTIAALTKRAARLGLIHKVRPRE